MFSPEIARQLRQRGYDVIAADERRDLAMLEDPELFAAAQAEGRAIVTNDVGGFLPLDRLSREHSRAHFGLILTSDRRFPRSREGIGRLVVALEAFLRTQPADSQATSLVHWLQ